MSKNSENKLVPELRFPEFRNDGEWKENKLDDLCKFVRGPFGGALKKEIFVNEGYAVYEQQHAIYDDFTSFRYFISQEKYNELKRFSVLPKDIIMSCSGTMGKFAVIPESSKEGVINQALLKLTVKPDYEIGFIKTSLELPVTQNKLLSQSAGGAIKNVVEVAQIKEIKLLIPDKKEQQKIAACLSSLDEVITAERQKLALYKEHKKGLLQNLLPQAGETVPKFRFKEFADSGEWVKKKLGEIADVSKLAGYEFTKHIVYEEKGRIIALRGLNIKNNKLYLSDVKYIDNSEFVKLNRSKLYVDDLMFTYIGTIGEVALIDENNKYYLAPNVSRIRANKEEVSPQFLLQYFNVPDFKEKEIAKYISSSSQPALTMENVRKFQISLPSQKEQHKIASTLSSIDDLITAQNQKLEALQLHKKGLLQGLFPNVHEVTA